MDTTIQGIRVGLKNLRIQGVECILTAELRLGCVEFGASGSGFGFGALGLGCSLDFNPKP